MASGHPVRLERIGRELRTQQDDPGEIRFGQPRRRAPFRHHREPQRIERAHARELRRAPRRLGRHRAHNPVGPAATRPLSPSSRSSTASTFENLPNNPTSIFQAPRTRMRDPLARQRRDRGPSLREISCMVVGAVVVLAWHPAEFPVISAGARRALFDPRSGYSP